MRIHVIDTMQFQVNFQQTNIVYGNAFFFTQVLISQWNVSDNNLLGVEIPDA